MNGHRLKPSKESQSSHSELEMKYSYIYNFFIRTTTYFEPLALYYQILFANMHRSYYSQVGKFELDFQLQMVVFAKLRGHVICMTCLCQNMRTAIFISYSLTLRLQSLIRFDFGTTVKFPMMRQRRSLWEAIWICHLILSQLRFTLFVFFRSLLSLEMNTCLQLDTNLPLAKNPQSVAIG